MGSVTASKAYVYLYIPKDLAEWLKERAEEERRSFNNYVSLILEDYYEQYRRSVRCTPEQ